MRANALECLGSADHGGRSLRRLAVIRLTVLARAVTPGVTGPRRVNN